MDQGKLQKVADVLVSRRKDLQARILTGACVEIAAAVLTYAELSQLAGVSTAEGVAAYLNRLSGEAADLDCLMVSKKSGRPSTPKYASGWEDALRACIPGIGG